MLYNWDRCKSLTGPTAVTVNLWHSTLRNLGWKDIITTATPLWDTQGLGELIGQFGFAKWDLIGISTVEGMWFGTDVKPWRELREEFQLAPTEVFRYLQIRHAIRSKVPKDTPLPDPSPLEARLLSGYMECKAISLTYCTLINNTPDTMARLRGKWSVDLGELDDDERTEALASPKESAIRARFRLVQLKILHRVYYTQAILYRMDRATLDISRGCGEYGSFFHVLWECTRLRDYWLQIHNTVTEL